MGKEINVHTIKDKLQAIHDMNKGAKHYVINMTSVELAITILLLGELEVFLAREQDELEDDAQLPDNVPDNNVGKWIPVSERLPGKNGEYLITVEGKRMGRYIRYIRHVGFALNLYKVDKDYFADRKGVAGFYMYDGEFGYFEVMNVVAWMPLPEPYVPDTNIGKMSASPTGAERSDKE